MNTYGPYIVDPANFFNGVGAENHIQVPVMLSQDGLVEIVNLSHYTFQVSLQAKGQVTQEGRSKVIYKGVGNITGTQMVDITIPFLLVSQNGANDKLFNPGLSRNNPGNIVYVNTYEAGEIDWYPPVTLGPIVPQTLAAFSTAAATSGAIALTVPNTTDAYQNTNTAFATCYLTGFDLSVDSATATAFGTMTITGLKTQTDGSNTINYELRSTQNSLNPGSVLYSIRYPDPIPNQPGQHIVVSVPALSATKTLTVFYFLE